MKLRRMDINSVMRLSQFISEAAGVHLLAFWHAEDVGLRKLEAGRL